MTVTYDLQGQKRIYAFWAPIYDAIYAKFLDASQRRLADAASACGGDILEVGVGTGLVLPFYKPGTRVVGVDLSREMLLKAQDKVTKLNLTHVHLLAAMDACRLGFSDATFDAVTLPFVVTLVPDPEGALTECARVLKPGGEIIIASRFGAEGGHQAKFESTIAPLAKALGLSTTFKVSRVANWAERHGGMALIEVWHGRYFKVLRLKKAAH